MEEFTNGTSVTLPSRHPARISDTHPRESRCPYCEWVYDHPERAIPDHATCNHLIAVAHQVRGDEKRNATAIITPNGSWRCWSQGDPSADQKHLEHSFGRLNVKVESATAIVQRTDTAPEIINRYYFARRVEQAVAELATIPSECNDATKISMVTRPSSAAPSRTSAR